MRVGVFTYGMDKQLTGIGRYTVEVLQHLRRIAPTMEIVLINPYRDSSLPIYKEFEHYLVPRLTRLPAVLTMGAWTLEQAAQQLRLDILHDPCGIAPFPAMRFANRHWKRVVTVHDAVPLLFPKLQPALTRITFQTRVRWSRFSSDAIVTVSKSAKSDLMHTLKVPESKIHVTELATFQPSLDEIQQWRGADLTEFGIRNPYFLFVGSVNPRKNVTRALQAFASLIEAGTDAQFVLAGPPSHLLETIELSGRTRERIISTGYLGDEQLHVLYANAAAVVYPSLYEGFGLPVLEGMAHATPVISSNVSSIPEVAGDAALLVDPTDTSAILRSMQTVLSDESLVSHLRQEGYKQATHFDWANTAKKTLQVYEALLATR